MHVVVFGLTISSSWGNGHATLWRSLVRALVKRGHTFTFYEKDVSYYADTRDLWELTGGAKLCLYSTLEDLKEQARRELDHADLAICTSFCPDGRQASDLILNSKAAVRAFYDMDTPVTLDALRAGEDVPYLPTQGLSDFDLVLSYTGGRALEELQKRLGARNVAPLYGWVDPGLYRPMAAVNHFRSSLSYLGTYAADRQQALTELFLQSAAMLPNERFFIGGAQYPAKFPWSENIFFTGHLTPSRHPEFFCSSRATLNVTRRAMAEYGYCPSGRLFEAAACGVPLMSDVWEGMDSFFAPDKEIFMVRRSQDVINVLSRTDEELRRVADRARMRTLEENTGDCRAIELENLCERASSARAYDAIAS
jgi:spore maturation protein CgeB